MNLIKDKKIILDASVVVKWFSYKDETDFEKAHQILDFIHQKEVKVVFPDLIIYEVSNALLKGKRLSFNKLNMCLQTLFELNVEFLYPELAVIQKAHEIAIDFDLTVYDAIYVAFAQMKNCQLITANPRCFSKVKESFVINLSDMEI